MDPRPAPWIPPHDATLTLRQWQTLRLLALGYSYKQVAALDGISRESVAQLVHRTYVRLDAETLVDALRAVGWLIVPE